MGGESRPRSPAKSACETEAAYQNSGVHARRVPRSMRGGGRDTGPQGRQSRTFARTRARVGVLSSGRDVRALATRPLRSPASCPPWPRRETPEPVEPGGEGLFAARGRPLPRSVEAPGDTRRGVHAVQQPSCCATAPRPSARRWLACEDGQRILRGNGPNPAASAPTRGGVEEASPCALTDSRSVGAPRAGERRRGSRARARRAARPGRVPRAAGSSLVRGRAASSPAPPGGARGARPTGRRGARRNQLGGLMPSSASRETTAKPGGIGSAAAWPRVEASRPGGIWAVTLAPTRGLADDGAP